ncbi:hypothetical protein FA10DRAFT_259313 [Acaromyces ingoldii]|uniref:Uncharacterized protein n=1 Tax=Acaromyces ingoldii TaxID=215250 RepID=A0A316YVG4_9BASI|nr:hypothetical protein FA10DRAFT_259313 [Acaromyces ingoldii]PWN92053.1 hypothetical protein FA10DRAFT_259313 [Acaromyces ingoldii]
MAAIIMTNDTEEDFENLTSDDEYARYPARRHGGMGKLATFFGEDEEDIDQVLSKRGPLLGKSRMPRPVAHHMRSSRSVTDLSDYTRMDEGERLNRGTSLSLERDQRRHMTDFSPGHILSSNSFSPSKAPATSSTSGSSTTIATPRWERRRSSSTASSHSRNSMLSLPTDSQPSQVHSSQDHADYRASLELRAANLPPALGGSKRRHAPRVAKSKPRDPLEDCRPDQVARLRRKWAMTRMVELPAKFPQQRMDLEAVTILEHRLTYRDAASTKLSSRISKMGLAKTWKKRFVIFSTNALAHPNDENNLMRWQACRSTNRWSEGARDEEDDDSRYDSMSMMTANSSRTRRKRVKGRAEGGKVDSDDGMGEAAINFVFDFDEQRYEPVSEPYACLSTYRTGTETEMEVERLFLSGDSTVTVPSKSAAEHGTDGHLLEIRGKLVSALTVKQDERRRSSDITTVWLLRFECVNVLMSWLKIMRSAIIALEREERFFHEVLAGQARTSSYSDDRQRHSLRPPVFSSGIASTRLSLDGHQSKEMPDPPLSSGRSTEALPAVKALTEEKMTRPNNTVSKEQGPTSGEEPHLQNSILPQSLVVAYRDRFNTIPDNASLGTSIQEINQFHEELVVVDQELHFIQRAICLFVGFVCIWHVA